MKLELQLQAYLDGELSASELRNVEALLQDDQEASALLKELRFTRDAFKGNESVRILPESGDFYWSKIRREIASAAPAQRTTRVRTPAFWLRLLPPVAVAMSVVLLSINTIRIDHQGGVWDTAEVTNMDENSSSVSFRSPSEKMFVVWVSDRSDEQTKPDDDEIE